MGKRQIYKIIKKSQILGAKSQFIRIKVQKQLYLGRPSITIYLRDVTKKINCKMEQIVEQEERTKLQQSENFKSSVSHEMRTPLNSAIFFLRQVIAMFAAYENLPADFTKEALKLCSFMMSQLTLTTTFVDDLLDMKQIHEGVFTLQTAPFNPNEVLELIQAIF